MANNIKVKPIWSDPKKLTGADMAKIYVTCERGVATRCINTRAQRIMAQVTNREVRHISTAHGYVNWSECVDGVWGMYRAPLALEYARDIDAYDLTGQHFALPKKAPFGDVEYKGPCVDKNKSPRVDPRKPPTPRKPRTLQAQFCSASA